MKTKFRYKDFWRDCRAAREARGWSRAVVGKQFGVGGSAVAKWEANKLVREDLWRIMDLCLLYDFDIYHYYEVIERPSIAKKRLIEDKPEDKRRVRGGPWLTVDEIYEKVKEAENIGYDEEFGLSLDEWQVKYYHAVEKLKEVQ